MPEEKQMIINGYIFDSQEEYEKALDEKKAIDFLNKKLNLNDKKMVLAIYNNVVGENKFSTVIGLEYLRKLRAVIIKQKYAEPGDVALIRVEQFKPNKAESFKLLEAEKKIRELRGNVEKSRERMKTSFLLSGVLIVIIGVMVYIASTSNNVNILNYETQIRNKYSYWENNLREKEAYLSIWEKQLESIETSQ